VYARRFRRHFSDRARSRRALARRHAAGVSLMVIGLSAASFGFLVPAASGTDASARVFSEGVNIKLDRASPAYAALEDTWSTSTISVSGEAQPPAIELSVSSVSPAAMKERVAKIVRYNQREQALFAQERGAREMNRRALAQAAAEALRRMSASLVPPQPVLKPAKKVAAANGQQAGPTKTVSLSDLKMSREELLSSLFLPIANSKPTEAPKGVQPFRLALATQPRKAPPPSSPPAGAETPNNERRRDRSRTQMMEQSFTACSPQPPAHQLVISGPIELIDGMALSNALDRLVVFREVDGEQVESGAVWLQQGRYEIFVEENSGLIVGELRTPYGDVIGRGQIEANCAPAPQANSSKANGVALRIKPVPQGMGGRVLAYEADGGSGRGKTALAGAEVVFRDLPYVVKADREGRFEEQHLLEGSNAIVEVNRPGYWGTLTFAHAGSENHIELFSNRDDQMIRHLMEIARSQPSYGAKSAAIIWGRVTKGGKPIAGARVELLTTAAVVRPVYFNSALLPDPSLAQTSANGLYAFFPVAPGAHAVQAALEGDELTEPAIFPAEDKMISRMDIETAVVRQARVKVFDAFATDRPLAADLTSPGSNQGLRVDGGGTANLRYAENRSLLIIDSDAGNLYRPSRIAISRDRNKVYIPMIAVSWLDGMRGQLRVNLEPGTGTVVGFVQGQSPYKIALEDRSLLPSSRVIYFNSRGEPSNGGFGQPGGGFVIFNVPEGFRTITVQPSGQQKMHASVALVESKVVSVISHWIR